MKNELINGVLHRNGLPLICPFRTPNSFVLPPENKILPMRGSGGVNAEIVPSWCAANCPLMVLKQRQVILKCGCAPVVFDDVTIQNPPSVPAQKPSQ